MIMIIINWAVYNHGFFQRAFFGKQKEAALFPSVDPRVSPTPRCGRRALPPDAGLRDSTGRRRPQPGGWLRCVPRTAPSRAPAPAPAFPAGSLPAGRGGGLKRRGGCDGDMEAVTSVLVPWAWRPLCVLAGVGGFLFVLFCFSVDFFLLFQKARDTDQHCSAYAWSRTEERLWKSCGGGEAPAAKQTRCFRSCFYFQKPTTHATWSLSPPRRGASASLTSAPPWKPPCLAPETPQFFVHLLPSPSP